MIALWRDVQQIAVLYSCAWITWEVFFVFAIWEIQVLFTQLYLSTQCDMKLPVFTSVWCMCTVFLSLPAVVTEYKCVYYWCVRALLTIAKSKGRGILPPYRSPGVSVFQKAECIAEKSAFITSWSITSPCLCFIPRPVFIIFSWSLVCVDFDTHKTNTFLLSLLITFTISLFLLAETEWKDDECCSFPPNLPMWQPTFQEGDLKWGEIQNLFSFQDLLWGSEETCLGVAFKEVRIS